MGQRWGSAPSGTPGRGRRPRLLRWLAFLPLLEIVVVLVLGSQWGWWQTIGLVALTSAAGLAVVLVEGRAAARAFRRARQARQVPADEALDAMLIVAGALLLIFPGLVSDVLGILLVLPPTRSIARRAVRRSVAARAGVVPAPAGWPSVAPGVGEQWPSSRPQGPGGMTDPRTETVQGSVVRDEP